jgi:hypothetical protein
MKIKYRKSCEGGLGETAEKVCQEGVNGHLWAEVLIKNHIKTTLRKNRWKSHATLEFPFKLCEHRNNERGHHEVDAFTTFNLNNCPRKVHIAAESPCGWSPPRTSGPCIIWGNSETVGYRRVLWCFINLKEHLRICKVLHVQVLEKDQPKTKVHAKTLQYIVC